MNTTYPLYEEAGLYFDQTLIPYVMLAYDRKNDTIPEDVQLLQDMNKFDAAALQDNTYTIGDAIKDYPEKANLLKPFSPEMPIQVLMPTEYMSGELLSDAVDDLNFDNIVTASDFEGCIQTLRTAIVPKPICLDFNNQTIFYLQPEKEASYFKQAYKNIKELIGEYDARLKTAGVILPAAFKLSRLICTINGTYYC